MLKILPFIALVVIVLPAPEPDPVLVDRAQVALEFLVEEELLAGPFEFFTPDQNRLERVSAALDRAGTLALAQGLAGRYDVLAHARQIDPLKTCTLIVDPETEARPQALCSDQDGALDRAVNVIVMETSERATTLRIVSWSRASEPTTYPVSMNTRVVRVHAFQATPWAELVGETSAVLTPFAGS